MKEGEINKNDKQGFLLKTVLVGAVVLIAISLFIYVLRPSKTKSTFEACYEKCITLGLPPENGKCDERYYLGVRKTDMGEWKKGDPWCIISAGYCLSFCKK